MSMACTLCNTAKIRQALEGLLAWVDKHSHAFSVQVYPVREDDEAVEKELGTAKEDARLALASPPRNCDRFANAADALQAFEQAVSPRWRADWEQKDWVQFAKWLFATTWDGKDAPADGEDKEGCEE